MDVHFPWDRSSKFFVRYLFILSFLSLLRKKLVHGKTKIYLHQTQCFSTLGVTNLECIYKLIIVFIYIYICFLKPRKKGFLAHNAIVLKSI